MAVHRPHALDALLKLMADDPKRTTARPVQRRFIQVLNALEKTRARYAICGAVAMGAHGPRRFTEDIDVLVAENDVEAVARELGRTMRELGREPAEGPAKQVRLRSKRARDASSIDVDLLVPVDVVEAWALATAVRARAFGRKVDVASPESLVVMKLRAYLSDPESPAGGKHLVDAITLAQTVALDRAGLRAFVRSHPDLAAELERVFAAPPPRGRLG